MRGVTFSNFAAKKFDSQKVDHGSTLSPRIFIRFARKNSPSGNQPLDRFFVFSGEPIMYPKINEMVDLLHSKKISSFLVTNAQFPDAIR